MRRIIVAGAGEDLGIHRAAGNTNGISNSASQKRFIYITDQNVKAQTRSARAVRRGDDARPPVVRVRGDEHDT